jgi:2-keto-4-pentenoate hydratase
MTPVSTIQILIHTMNARAIAEQFVHARLRAEALPTFPNGIPPTLDAAYAIQDVAIELWPDRLAGWKVGRIEPPWSDCLGEDRLVGPVFQGGIRSAGFGEVVEFPVFEGGFAAVEAEFAFRLGEDADGSKVQWTVEEVEQLACSLHVGIETAGSPLAAINDLGPLVVISDFGNNAGLLLGPEVTGWRERRLESLTSETFIGERSVGRGGALSLPGGPLAALAFALQRCAARGRPLTAGSLVSTGAMTGIHQVRSGDSVCVRFGDVAELRCRAVPASPQARSPG